MVNDDPTQPTSARGFHVRDEELVRAIDALVLEARGRSRGRFVSRESLVRHALWEALQHAKIRRKLVGP